jgi:hypothetical protein
VTLMRKNTTPSEGSFFMCGSSLTQPSLCG